MAAAWWRRGADGIEVVVHVLPGARRSELVATTADALRIRVAAPAREGRANAELERFVAGLFGVRRSAVKVVRGDHARDKVVAVAGIARPPAGLLGPS